MVTPRSCSSWQCWNMRNMDSWSPVKVGEPASHENFVDFGEWVNATRAHMVATPVTTYLHCDELVLHHHVTWFPIQAFQVPWWQHKLCPCVRGWSVSLQPLCWKWFQPVRPANQPEWFCHDPRGQWCLGSLATNKGKCRTWQNAKNFWNNRYNNYILL